MKTPRPTTPAAADSQRIAKVIARAGVCSRRDAEQLIAEGRVALNGRVLDTPAVTVKPGDTVTVDGQPLPARDRTRLWLFHKPRGYVTTTHDPEGRPTVFDLLPPDLPRVVTVGRLDINTEGLLLLTNDGGLARVLELPKTGWLRRYRVRAHGAVEQAALDALGDGIAIDGIFYGAVEAAIDRRQGDNVWLTMGLREGKNREVKTILAHLGMDVTRLIRVSYGPFQLGDLKDGEVREVPRKHLKDQLGATLAAEAGADFALREGERQPVMPRPGAPEAEPVRPARPVRPPRRPDAAASRRRHEADVEHAAEAGPRRPRLALAGRRAADAEPAPADRRQRTRREVAEARRAGGRRAEPVVEAKPRRPVEEPEAPPRGRARFERPDAPRRRDDAAPRAPRPARPQGDRPSRGYEGPDAGGRPARGPRPDAASRGAERGPRPERGGRPSGAAPDRAGRGRDGRGYDGPEAARPSRGPRPDAASRGAERGPRPERGGRPGGAAPDRAGRGRDGRGYEGPDAGGRPPRGPRPGGAGGRPGGKPGGRGADRRR